MTRTVSVALAALLLAGSLAFAGEVKRTLALSGLTCSACSAAVTKALKGIEGVHEVTVSKDRRRAVVVADEQVAPSALVKAVTRLGYGAKIETP